VHIAVEREGDATALPDDVMTSEQVVDGIIAHLADGPTWYAGDAALRASAELQTMSRNDAVRAVLQQESILRD